MIKNDLKKIYIFGAGTTGREVLRIISDINNKKPSWDVLGFVDNNSDLVGEKIDDVKVFHFTELKGIENFYAVCCAYDSKIRKNIIEKEIQYLGLKLTSIIHPDVFIPSDASIDDGVIIYSGTKLSFSVSIGKACLIFFNSLLGHDLNTGPYCTFSPSVCLNGSISMGEGVFLGSGVTVHQGVNIGDWTSVGIGSIIINNLGKNKSVMDMPRQIISDRSD